jgi:hypothetical protein
MKNNKKVIAIVLVVFVVGGFLFKTFAPYFKNSKGIENNATENGAVLEPADFMTDSCYAFIQKQVAFGPRVPGNANHAACGNWLISKFKSYNCIVKEQLGSMPNWEGGITPVRNIIASVHAGATKRIVLAAHWDSRPYGDKDPDPSKHKQPIDGANDGASGVGVLLELARISKNLPEDIGVDFILFDSEDGGKPEWAADGENDAYSWCLGSQFWAKQKPQRTMRYAVLLDMVGAEGARFHKEGYSMQSAGNAVNRIWGHAAKLGYGEYFTNEETAGIVDDHLFMIQANVPSLDIVDMRPNFMGTQFEFGGSHHTHSDNMSVISKPTLKAVGHTLAYTVWNLK